MANKDGKRKRATIQDLQREAGYQDLTEAEADSTKGGAQAIDPGLGRSFQPKVNPKMINAHSYKTIG